MGGSPGYLELWGAGFIRKKMSELGEGGGGNNSEAEAGGNLKRGQNRSTQVLIICI